MSFERGFVAESQTDSILPRYKSPIIQINYKDALLAPDDVPKIFCPPVHLPGCTEANGKGGFTILAGEQGLTVELADSKSGIGCSAQQSKPMLTTQKEPACTAGKRDAGVYEPLALDRIGPNSVLSPWAAEPQQSSTRRDERVSSKDATPRAPDNKRCVSSSSSSTPASATPLVAELDGPFDPPCQFSERDTLVRIYYRASLLTSQFLGLPLAKAVVLPWCGETSSYPRHKVATTAVVTPAANTTAISIPSATQVRMAKTSLSLSTQASLNRPGEGELIKVGHIQAEETRDGATKAISETDGNRRLDCHRILENDMYVNIDR
ncbi:unnamed protein product [Protopolystoma xenopodis]|uniref:Uncharacterized protein n=1 Tax=Protopolystoma xenopodis TaxID=117903 RepID=A0A448XK90_9PLAT|nr:unnamed protein product [Protopolystoma xenopodis]